MDAGQRNSMTRDTQIAIPDPKWLGSEEFQSLKHNCLEAMRQILGMAYKLTYNSFIFHIYLTRIAWKYSSTIVKIGHA